MKRWMLVLFCLTLLLAGLNAGRPLPSAPSAQARPGGQQALEATESAFLPLPRGCVGSLPPGQGVPACCINGYVFIDGQPVAGARLTITSARGSLKLWTQHSPDHALPYYRASLSDPPLQLQAGESITIVAEYGSHRRALTHTVLSGGQQVDLVLARQQAEDYVVERQVWGQAQPGGFNRPVGLAVDATDTVYVVDSANARVQVFNSAGVFLRQWGRLGNRPGEFRQPTGIAIDPQGNVLVADTGNHRIQKFTSTGTWLAAWGEYGSGPGAFDSPQELAADSSGRIYVLDYGNQRIQKLSSDGTWLSAWGIDALPARAGLAIQQDVLYLLGSDLTKYSLEGTLLQRINVRSDLFAVGSGSLVVDAAGQIFIAETAHDRIIEVNSQGQVERIWGALRPEGWRLYFEAPMGIGLDSQGYLYVVDAGHYEIEKFHRTTSWIQSWQSSGHGIAIDPDGYVYTIEATGLEAAPDYRIAKHDSQGVVVARWGSAGNGPGQLNAPRWLASDSQGNLYVSDVGNQRIQKFSSSGAWLGSWGGEGSAAGQFLWPGAIAVDAADQLYVLDRGNARIQVFSQEGAWLRQLALPRPAPSPPQDWIQGLAVDAAGRIYLGVENSSTSVLQILDQSGQVIDTCCYYHSSEDPDSKPCGVAVGHDGVVYFATRRRALMLVTINDSRELRGLMGGPRALPLQNACDIASDRQGNTYIVDAGSRVWKVRPSDPLPQTWGRHGEGRTQLDAPRAVAVAADGTFYVADGGSRQLKKVYSDGTWSSIQNMDRDTRGWWNLYDLKIDSQGLLLTMSVNGIKRLIFNGFSTSAVDYPEPSLMFRAGLALQGDTLYAIDSEDGRLYQYSYDGSLLEQRDARISSSTLGFAVDQQGLAYLSDAATHTIQRLALDGSWLPAWGGPGSGNGQFASPAGVELHPSGALFVVDQGNHRIQKLSSSGAWLGTWGRRGSGPGEFESPSRLTFDASGRIYIADTGNNRIQVLRPMTYDRPIATLVSAGPRRVVQGQPVELVGMGADSDETPALASYAWYLNGSATPFATTASASLPTDSLPPGPHSISFVIQDTEGQRSTPQTLSIEVVRPAPQPIETWTLMLYLDGDTAPDNLGQLLGRDTPIGALARLEHVVSNPHVPVVALFDGPHHGDSYRYLLQPDGEIVITPLGEQAMDAPQTLVDFVRWGQQAAPADHYYLALVDHASPLDGLAWDHSSGAQAYLSMAELRGALLQISEGGARPLDVLHLDVCLLGTLETAYQLRGTTRYLVASQNLAWSVFAYERYRGAIGERTSPQELAQAVVDGYVARIREVEQEEAGARYPYTIAALDMQALDGLARAMDGLAQAGRRYALASPAHRAELAGLRSEVQTLDADGNIVLSADDSFIDLGHWAALLAARVTDSPLQQAAAEAQAALGQLVVHEQHRSGHYRGQAVELEQARGLGVYYPRVPGAELYTRYAGGELSWPVETDWDEYLAAALDQRLFRAGHTGAPTPLAPLGVLGTAIYLPNLRR